MAVKVYLKIFLEEFNPISEQTSLTNGQKIFTPACDRLLEETENKVLPR